MRIIFPLLFPRLSRGPTALWTRFLQCVFSWLASQLSEASGVALVEIRSANNAAACPAHVNVVTTLLCQLPGAVGEPQSKYPWWPPFLPADVCCVQVPVWPRPPLCVSAHCRAMSTGWAGVAGTSLLNRLCLISMRPIGLSVCTGCCGCWGVQEMPWAVTAYLSRTLSYPPPLASPSDTALVDSAVKLIVLG